jgi:DNA excision repair protein ERCC-8
VSCLSSCDTGPVVNFMLRLLSGGADSSISIWDLEQLTPASNDNISKPKGAVPKYVFRPMLISPTSLNRIRAIWDGKADIFLNRGLSAHKFGITQLSFYPFDSAAFLSSSYDHSLKLYSTNTLTASASFDLDSIIYTHALSPIASHLLVACATQHPAVRLVDLRSGSSAHSLAGHHGAVLSVAWSPTNEYILATGDTNGTARLWDVRKSAGTLGLLDMEDSVGIAGHDGMGTGARSRCAGKAHNGAVNGLAWTDDGAFIITAGHDERVRVWDAATGANTLASFGPTLKNSHLSTISLLASPTSVTPPRKEILFYPNEQELLIFVLHEGKLVKRLKVPGPVTATVRSRTGERNVPNRITALTWRGISEGIYSGHSDGQIRVWAPQMAPDEDSDTEESHGIIEGTEGAGLKRKRQILDDIFKDLTRQKITFG